MGFAELLLPATSEPLLRGSAWFNTLGLTTRSRAAVALAVSADGEVDRRSRVWFWFWAVATAGAVNNKPIRISFSFIALRLGRSSVARAGHWLVLTWFCRTGISPPESYKQLNGPNFQKIGSGFVAEKDGFRCGRDGNSQPCENGAPRRKS